MSRPRKSYTLWILGHVLRALCGLAIFAMCAFLVWRVAFSQKPPKDMRYLADNEILSAAYEANGGELTVLTQDQIPYTQAADKNYAYYNLDHCVFLKEADQVQLVLFYNDSTLERLQQELGLATCPPRGEEVFSVVLTQYVDVTPDGGETQTEPREFTPTATQYGTNSMYTFVRYTFDGVDLEDVETVVIFLDIFYADEAESRGTLRLYHRESLSEERTLNNKERKEIEG